MPTRIAPRCTYRLQLNGLFTFTDAASLLDYLDALGVSHVYAAPCLQAVPGSLHGYDVVDPAKVSADLGGEPGRAAFASALRARGMGLLLDIVPNHMAIGSAENLWWWDVLKHGPASAFARFFDIDWEPPEARQRQKVLLPVLGDHYRRLLDDGEIVLERRESRLQVRYGPHSWPLAPRSLGLVLEAARGLSDTEGLEPAIGALMEARGAGATDGGDDPGTEAAHPLLAALEGGDGTLGGAIDAALNAINGEPRLLHAVLEEQHYRLAHWRSAERELNYRRFFEVNTLAGVRVEDAGVFDAVHALPLAWVREGAADGLRVDHVDGLRFPQSYLERLRSEAPGARILVEKILSAGERLPSSWPVDGTTGYEFLNVVNGLFVDPAAEAPLTRLYAELTGEVADYEALLADKKLQVMRELLGSEVERLTALLLRLCEEQGRYRDFQRHELRQAIAEVLASLPVYRTYADPSRGSVSVADAAVVASALGRARRRRVDLDPGLFDLLEDVLLLRLDPRAWGEFVLSLQQSSGAVMAKGVEDTAFYCYNRLVSLNEVGGEPSRFGVSPEEFHAFCAEAAQERPLSMLTTSTHDTKRSEDVRLRIDALSELPQDWAEAVARWFAITEGYCLAGLPDRNARYLFFQTLVGAWPIDTNRLQAFMLKAAREAKVHTAWLRPDAAYERALAAFVASVMAERSFVSDLEGFVALVAGIARRSSLSQTLLKLTVPGVPDIYQGTEVWDLSLVDPDNRRPVDFAALRALLDEANESSAASALSRMDGGMSKLWLMSKVLALRRARPEAFAPGAAYEPLYARGSKAANLVAFCRGGTAITVAPRLWARLEAGWGDTVLPLPEGRWRDIFTDARFGPGDSNLGQLLSGFPVALLVRETA